MFWLLCALLTLAVAAAIAAPLWQARHPKSGAEFDLEVYRDQLRETDRDVQRGIINAEEAEQRRTEISRKVLDADKRAKTSAPIVSQQYRIGALALLAVVISGAIALYLLQGAPDRQDLPLSKRLAMAELSYQSRPSQAEAEAAAPAEQTLQADPEYLKLVEQLREKVAQRQDDHEGLTLLATHEMQLGNIQAAKEAQQKLVSLQGAQANAGELLKLSALMIEAAGGLITPEAENVLAQALKKDPQLPLGRYFMGMLQLQNGRADRAFPIWRDLLENGPADAPWVTAIRANIQDLAWLAGFPEYTPPEAAAPEMPGPDAEAITAAENMTPEQRSEFIKGMVTQLESRLANEGGTPQEWARLISSLGILGQTEKAQAIYDEAKQRFGAEPEVLKPIVAAAKQAGLTE